MIINRINSYGKKVLVSYLFSNIRKNEVTYKYIKSDAFRIIGGGISEDRIVRLFQEDATFRWLVYFRIHNTHCKINKLCVKILNHMNEYVDRIQIPIETKIGYGLYIGHGGPVVINSTAVLGCNCNLSQFTTIGSNEGKAANIGDNVYIGPNVCVVEDVCIGNNVTIGAGSVVTKNIPNDATAVGNYAKVINYNDPARFINNRWSDQYN